MRPTVSLLKTNRSKNLLSRLKTVVEQAVYVGIPSTTADQRSTTLREMADDEDNAYRKKSLLEKAGVNQVNNAELLFIFSKGSPLNHQPAREVIEPAIKAEGNKEAIAHEIAEATRAKLAGDNAEATIRLKRAGIAGVNASKGWFKDPRNNWAPNAPRTVLAKGSDQPGIDTSGMINAITYVVDKEGSHE
jgi:hypothetical protein